jgi:phosphatidylserine/phosphatidylglycerophosphate/cardiolipin synthase-like enzyme
VATTPGDFLLSPQRGDSAAFPIRSGVEVKPLIGGEAALAAMEAAIAGAKRHVYLAAWTFLPSLPCVSGAAKTWKALLQKAGARADVRLLLNDMDPVNSNYHQRAWSAYREMITAAGQVAQQNPRSDKRFEIICSLHEARIDLFSYPKSVLDQLDAALRKENLNIFSHITRNLDSSRLIDMPLLWENVRYDSRKGFVPADQIKLTVHIATHHQKLCIVDGTVAFCGGIDVTGGRTGEGWRDVHCQVKGAAVADLEANFITRWNSEFPKFRAFVEQANSQLTDVMKVKKFEIPLRKNTKIAASAPAAAGPPDRQPDPGKAFAQVQRTLSEAGNPISLITSSAQGATSFLSTPIAVEVRDMYRRAIASARDYIYIENQYLRSTALADWIVQRLRDLGRSSKLQVIIVVPAAVEEKDKLVTGYGEFLQAQAIARLQEAFEGIGAAKSFGVFSTRRSYVHSKIMIIDDVFATIGSANGNRRSFELDTEANVSWYEGASVKKLREDLWRSLLGNPKDFIHWPAAEYAKRWAKVAASNGGQIQPHKSAPGDGSLALFIPDILV